MQSPSISPVSSTAAGTGNSTQALASNKNTPSAALKALAANSDKTNEQTAAAASSKPVAPAARINEIGQTVGTTINTTA